MFWFCAALSAAGVLESLIFSCLVAELSGYWLPRLLGGDKLAFLSPRCIIHHLLLYGPQPPMCAARHNEQTHGRVPFVRIVLAIRQLRTAATWKFPCNVID
jgi:hypothetical protein